jgi:hypothetical protein
MACSLRRQSLLVLDTVLPVRIRFDQAGIDRKAFSAADSIDVSIGAAQKAFRFRKTS